MNKLQARQKQERKAATEEMLNTIANIKAQHPEFTDEDILGCLEALHIATMPLPAKRNNAAQALFEALINPKSKPKSQEVEERQTILCNAQDVYNALVAGAECEYNRSTDDYNVYKSLTKECDEQGNIPVTFLMFHHYKMARPCETHARIYIFSLQYIFDIPLPHWNRLNGKEAAERAELEAMAAAGNLVSKKSNRL